MGIPYSDAKSRGHNPVLSSALNITFALAVSNALGVLYNSSRKNVGVARGGAFYEVHYGS